MLQKKYRLKKYSAFIATYKQNHSISDKNICIYFGKEKQDTQNLVKIAFVVSKKVHKRAVVRNRIKRLMRENIRKILKENKFPELNNYLSVICVAKKQSTNTTFQEIQESILSIFQKKFNKN